MSGLGSAATTLIITKGLFIGDNIASVLEFGAAITPWFGLYVSGPLVSPNYVAAVGSRVYAPGEIANLYQPIDPNTGLKTNEPFLVPMDKEAEYFQKNKVITLKINFAGKQFESQYAVPENRARKLVEVMNFINSTRNKINVAINGFKRVASVAIVEARNFRLIRKSK